MIVCAIDDLIFSIKISTAAKQLGVDVYFERSRSSVLPTVREKQPSLVIFDLNSSRLKPMDGHCGDEGRSRSSGRVKTLGYVSHVDSDAIARGAAGGNRSGAGALGVRRAARRDPAVGLDVVSVGRVRSSRTSADLNQNHQASTATTSSMTRGHRHHAADARRRRLRQLLFLAGHAQRIEHGDRRAQLARQRRPHSDSGSPDSAPAP